MGIMGVSTYSDYYIVVIKCRMQCQNSYCKGFIMVAKTVTKRHSLCFHRTRFFFFVSCLRNGFSQPFKKLIVRKFSGINGNPSAKGNTLWPQGKHFLEHVILHSPVTIIGRGRKRERGKKLQLWRKR